MKKEVQLDANGHRKFGIRDSIAYALGDLGCNMSFALTDLGCYQRPADRFDH